MSAYIPYEPFSKQKLYLSLSAREVLWGGSAGCSKSSGLLMAALQGIAIPGYSAILLRRTYAELKLSGALMDRARSWWLDTDAKWCDDEKTWTFPSGARIGFGYLETDRDLDRYQSAEFHFIAPDEVTEFTLAQYTFLFSRLRRTKGQFPKSFPLRMRPATNPGGLGHDWVVERFGIPTDKPVPRGAPPYVTRNDDGKVRRIFVPAHPEDNPGLDWEDYNQSLAELTPIRQKQLKEGWWVQDNSGLVYESAPNAEYVDALPSGHEWSYVLIVDIGATNNCALGILAFAPDLPEVYVLEVTEPEGLNTPRDLAEHVLAMDSVYHFDRIRGDEGGLGKGYLEELRKYFGIPIEAVEKANKRGYIELVNGAIATKMLRFVRGGCNPWTQQANSLLWKDASRLLEMPGMRNHSTDVVLYGYREARHYSHTPRVKPAGADEVERAVIAAAELSRERADQFGQGLPDWFR